MNRQVRVILFSFLTWRILLFLIAFIAGLVITTFGARFPYYHETLISSGLPNWIWGFGNFDGVHYLRIAENGYSSQYSQAFFPLFPFLIKDLTVGSNYLLTGLVISNLFFIGNLFLLYKLFRLDYDQKISMRSIWLLMAFPTAFYFGAIYSESLFLFLVVLFFLFLRQKKYLFAGVVGAIASGTRIFGILLIIPLLFDFFILFKKKDLSVRKGLLIVISILLTFSGLFGYMVYLNNYFGDPLYFLNAQPQFGAARSSTQLIFLPQVFFRYIKILMTVPFYQLDFFNAFLEFLLTIFGIVLVFMALKKVKMIYILFSLGCLILPTLTGTLSSMPRYVLLMFLLFPTLAQLSGKKYTATLFIFSIIQIILVSLFIRGYWVA